MARAARTPFACEGKGVERERERKDKEANITVLGGMLCPRNILPTSPPSQEVIAPRGPNLERSQPREVIKLQDITSTGANRSRTPQVVLQRTRPPHNQRPDRTTSQNLTSGAHGTLNLPGQILIRHTPDGRLTGSRPQRSRFP